jgi:hypothetical protein
MPGAFNPYPNFSNLTNSPMAKKDTPKTAKVQAVKTTVKISGKIAEAIEIIKETQPHVKVAYFNQAGDYHFHKRPGFSAVPIQDEDTDLEVENEEVDEDQDEQPVDPGGKKLEF